MWSNTIKNWLLADTVLLYYYVTFSDSRTAYYQPRLLLKTNNIQVTYYSNVSHITYLDITKIPLYFSFVSKWKQFI